MHGNPLHMSFIWKLENWKAPEKNSSPSEMWPLICGYKIISDTAFGMSPDEVMIGFAEMHPALFGTPNEKYPPKRLLHFG